MNSDEKEIPRYYDFNYLLRPAPRMSTEEQNALQEKFLLTEDDKKDFYINASLSAMAILGDVMFSKDISFAPFVATEELMDATKAHMQQLNNHKTVIQDINSKFTGHPTAKMDFQRLMDFEWFLMRQTLQRRLTKKNKSV